MPIPLALGLAAAGLLGGVAQAAIGNRGAKKREEEARAFNREQWEAQNAYNNPIAQMQRLQEAGLNPNLIYGTSPSGASGNAGAVAPGKAADYKAPELVRPAIDSMMAYQDFNLKNAQTNNEQNRGDLILAQAQDAYASAQKKGWENKLFESTLQDQIDAFAAKTQQEQALAKKLIADGKVADATVANRIDQEAKKLALIAANAEGRQLNNVYQSWKNKLANDYGLSESDNYLMRILAEVFPHDKLNELKKVVGKNFDRAGKVIEFFDNYMNPLKFID